MKRVIEVEKEYIAKNLNEALNKFFKAHPELNYWREGLEYMGENGQDFDSDRTCNDDWCWAIHLDINEGYGKNGEKNLYHICIIERA